MIAVYVNAGAHIYTEATPALRGLESALLLHI